MLPPLRSRVARTAAGTARRGDRQGGGRRARRRAGRRALRPLRCARPRSLLGLARRRCRPPPRACRPTSGSYPDWRRRRPGRFIAPAGLYTARPAASPRALLRAATNQRDRADPGAGRAPHQHGQLQLEPAASAFAAHLVEALRLYGAELLLAYVDAGGNCSGAPPLLGIGGRNVIGRDMQSGHIQIWSRYGLAGTTAKRAPRLVRIERFMKSGPRLRSSYLICRVVYQRMAM